MELLLRREKEHNLIPCLFFRASFLSSKTGETFGFRVICAPEYFGRAILFWNGWIG